MCIRDSYETRPTGSPHSPTVRPLDTTAVDNTLPKKADRVTNIKNSIVPCHKESCVDQSEYNVAN